MSTTNYISTEDQQLKTYALEYIQSISDIKPDAQLIALNKWLPEQIAKLPKVEKTSQVITQITSKFPVIWSDKEVQHNVKPKFDQEVYAKYLSDLNSTEKPAPIPNLKEAKQISGIDDKYYTMTKTDFEQIISSKSQSCVDRYGLKLSEFARVWYIFDAIVELMNKVVTMDGDFCEEWRSFWVIPRFKGGDESDPKRFRPLIMMPIMVRMLDSFLSKKTHNLVLEQGILNTKVQKAVLRDTSGIFENIFEVNFKMHRMKMANSFGTVLFLDLANAYGSVNYNTMHWILKNGNYPAPLVNYFVKFYKRLMGKYGTSKFVWRDGLIQGSALSNILFLIYIDYTMKNVIQELKKMEYLGQDWNSDESLFGFVDDFTMFIDNMPIEKENSCFQLMELLFSFYGFKINCDKTVFYSPYEKKDTLIMGEKSIKRAGPEFKYLGMPLSIFDETGSWLVDKFQKCLFEIDSFNIEAKSKRTIYYNSIFTRLNRIIECMIYTDSTRKSYKTLMMLQKYFLIRWNSSIDDSIEFCEMHLPHIMIGLHNKLCKSSDLSKYIQDVGSPDNKTYLVSNYKMTNKQIINYQVGIGKSTKPSLGNKFTIFDQKYEKLEEELKAMKESNKYNPFYFKKMGGSFYSDNFVEHIN